jgi:hypothetical protein
MKTAQLYIRNNGSFGANCDGTADTGHTIHEDSGRFTVFSLDDGDDAICTDATRDEAQDAIARDWRKLY